MNDTALWWARVRAAGPQRVDPSSAFPSGMVRLVEPGVSAVWLLPELPEGARPGAPEELGIPMAAVEQPNDTARVLAACVRCCWREPAGPVWPGATASRDDVISVFAQITNRDDTTAHRAVIGALRRLAAAGWLLWGEPARTIRLGPRVASWNTVELSALRELWRMLPPATAGQEADEPR
ncbi:hypothetical protein ACWEV3_00885 [Saccharopolyspora sp. NPDC003752]